MQQRVPQESCNTSAKEEGLRCEALRSFCHTLHAARSFSRDTRASSSHHVPPPAEKKCVLNLWSEMTPCVAPMCAIRVAHRTSRSATEETHCFFEGISAASTNHIMSSMPMNDLPLTSSAKKFFDECEPCPGRCCR